MIHEKPFFTIYTAWGKALGVAGTFWTSKGQHGTTPAETDIYNIKNCHTGNFIYKLLLFITHTLTGKES